MKKFLLCCSFFLFFAKVEAVEPNVWTDEIVEESNVIIKDSEIRYKWYEEIVEYSLDYYIEENNDLLYPNIDYDDCIESDFSDWQEDQPLIKPQRLIEIKSVNRYRTLKPIRYLFLENFQGGFLKFYISELNVLINNVKKNVNITCNNCSPNFNNDITDESYITSAYINNGGSLKIDLGAYYSIEQIRIEMFMFDSTPNTKKFDLYFNEGDSLFDRNYAYKKFESYVVSANSSQPEKYLIIPDASYIVNPVFNDWIYIEDSVNTTYYRQMQFLPFYRYKDIKCRYYKKEKKYLEGYYNQIEDDKYIKDEETATPFYLYEIVNIEENSDKLIELDNQREIILITDDNNLKNKNISREEKELEKEVINTIEVEKSTEIKSDLLSNEPEKKESDKTNVSTSKMNFSLVFTNLCLLILLIVFLIKFMSHQK